MLTTTSYKYTTKCQCLSYLWEGGFCSALSRRDVAYLGTGTHQDAITPFQLTTAPRPSQPE